jgi:glycosyltransferase involved in cell wall biosynthesis
VPVCRVGFDEQIFTRQRRGGISRLFVQLMMELAQDTSLEVVTPFRYVASDVLAEGEVGRFRQLPTPMRLNARLARRLNSSARNVPLDVVHHTFYDPAYLHDHTSAKRVTTVVDMIPEQLPGADRAAHLAKRRFVASSDAVICISEVTRQAMLDVYGVPSGLVRVVRLAVSESFFHPPPRLARLPSEYLLFVGLRSGYKDFDLLVRAMAVLPRELRLPLVAVGGGALTAAERLAAERVGVDLHHRTLSDAELPSAYATASAFVFPSRSEGFGLPVLEAMAAGCPVLLADTPIFREVGGDIPARFVAGDLESLSTELAQLLLDGGSDSAQQRAWARTFTWSDVGQRTSQVYRELLGRQ